MINKELLKDCEYGNWINDYEPAISVKKKLKYEEGDHVVIIDATGSDKGFKSSYHPKWAWEAYGQIGTIVGRKAIGGSCIKYAVKVLSLKKAFPIHSNFLRKATEEEINLKQLTDKLPELNGIF
jgi:ribosomal protein L21E